MDAAAGEVSEAGFVRTAAEDLAESRALEVVDDVEDMVGGAGVRGVSCCGGSLSKEMLNM